MLGSEGAYGRLERSGVLDEILKNGSYKVDRLFHYAGGDGSSPRGGHAMIAIIRDLRYLIKDLGSEAIVRNRKSDQIVEVNGYLDLGKVVRARNKILTERRDEIEKIKEESLTDEERYQRHLGERRIDHDSEYQYGVDWFTNASRYKQIQEFEPPVDEMKLDLEKYLKDHKNDHRRILALLEVSDNSVKEALEEIEKRKINE